MQICKEAYQELIDGDIEWLLRQPRDIERDHIEAVLRKSVKKGEVKTFSNEYDPATETTQTKVVETLCNE